MNTSGSIYVFVEQKNGDMVPVVYELLGEAARLAELSKMKVCALLLKSNGNRGLKELFQYGADEIHILSAGSRISYREDIAIQQIYDFVREKVPDIFLIGSTIFGRSVAAGLAGLLQTGLTADCTGLQIKNGLLWQCRPACEGDRYATIVCRHHRPQMATIRPGCMKPICPDGARTGKIYQYTEAHPIQETYKIVESAPLKQSASPLEHAKIIIGIGMGIASKKNIEKLRQKAEQIGAVIGATRAVVDSGLLPASYQIGLTGSFICPELYIACGISGSVQHMSGISAKYIIAVNTDSSAAIFQSAQYGIVEDAIAIVPPLLEKLKESKTGHKAVV